MIYTIVRIRDKSGNPHEREARRKGHRVDIAFLRVGLPMMLVYIDEEDARLLTSPVEEYSRDGEVNPEDRLIVKTRDSVYVFEKWTEVGGDI